MTKGWTKVFASKFKENPSCVLKLKYYNVKPDDSRKVGEPIVNLNIVANIIFYSNKTCPNFGRGEGQREKTTSLQ